MTVHNRSQYLKGCRCDECRAANSDYMKARRLAKAAQSESGAKKEPAKASERHLNVVEMPSQPTEPESPTDELSVERAVREEIGKLDCADRPGLAAIAIRLAQVLDKKSAVAQYANASARLTDVMEQLRSTAPKKRSKLAELRQAAGK